MKQIIKLWLVLVSLGVLSACGGTPTATSSQAPESFTLGEDTLLSLNTAVALNDDYQFEQIEDAKNQTVTYSYTQLTQGSVVAQAYSRSLVKDWECELLEEGSVDFSHPSGQVHLIQHMEGSGHQLQIDIQWAQTSCVITLSLSQLSTQAPGSDSPTDTSTPAPSASILDDAVGYLESLSPSFLRLPGSDMDEFIVLCQDGTVYLNNESCLMLDVYQADTHKYQSSYLLTIPDFQVYQLDRSSGQTTCLD